MDIMYVIVWILVAIGVGVPLFVFIRYLKSTIQARRRKKAAEKEALEAERLKRALEWEEAEKKRREQEAYERAHPEVVLERHGYAFCRVVSGMSIKDGKRDGMIQLRLKEVEISIFDGKTKTIPISRVISIDGDTVRKYVPDPQTETEKALLRGEDVNGKRIRELVAAGGAMYGPIGAAWGAATGVMLAEQNKVENIPTRPEICGQVLYVKYSNKSGITNEIKLFQEPTINNTLLGLRNVYNKVFHPKEIEETE